MKKLTNLCLTAAIVFFGFQSVARAQEPGAQDARYLVQSGDTLSSIAARFNISTESLIAANNIANPNQLFQGDQLVLPGVDWISGLIVSTPMPLGESLRSFTRRYGLSIQDFSRLNRISSPAQMYLGYPVLLATQRGEDMNTARTVVGEQQSLLEIAAASGSNPWSLVTANHLRGTWDVIPGDVLLQPGTNLPGPGALPSPISSIQVGPTGFIQGKTAKIKVTTHGELSMRGEILGSQLRFFNAAPGEYVSLQGIHALVEPGFYEVTLTGASIDGSIFEYSLMVPVASGGYKFETITVDPALLDPVLEQAESEKVTALVTEATPEKLWSGYFQAPSPYTDSFNSLFGTRRSFNRSEFIYYHSGLDFEGGKGVQIFAPAVGVVVFASTLDVRGNATIINHGWGVYSGYWHQLEQFVKPGDIVQPGQVIGIVGNTGRSSGAHLHWEIWVGAIQVDPLEWLATIFP
ncbi:MAG: peptidoglycan DD-metalloendopeptidase family protein [Anaerolineae bacterium]|nr:peptidoglycan DD-metalloendopeptidase family protein [Anaerolineae bacterium]